MAGAPGEGQGAGGSSHRRPGPDGHHDDLDPRELGRLDVTIPDDASELDRDRERWLTEEALSPAPSPASPAAERSSDQRGDPWVVRQGERRRRLAVTAAVVLVSMVVVALSGAVGAWIVGPRATPAASPLATDAPDDGLKGGLLPAEAVLQNGESDKAAQSFRPAVFAVIPPSCQDCAELLTSLAPQAGTFGVPLVVVGTTAQASQLDQLADNADSARVVTLIDPRQILADVYGATTTTLVIVGADGVITEVIHEPLPSVQIESDLVEVVPGV